MSSPSPLPPLPSLHAPPSTRLPGPRQNALLLIKATQLQPEVKLDFEPTSVAVAPNEALIAVGSEGEPAAVYLLDAAGGVTLALTLTLTLTLP